MVAGEAGDWLLADMQREAMLEWAHASSSFRKSLGNWLDTFLNNPLACGRVGRGSDRGGFSPTMTSFVSPLRALEPDSPGGRVNRETAIHCLGTFATDYSFLKVARQFTLGKNVP